MGALRSINPKEVTLWRREIENRPGSRRSPRRAQQAGLNPAEFPALLVEGDDRPGLGHRFASAVADRGINMSFLVAQIVGRKYSAIFGFETKEDARAAPAVIKIPPARTRSRIERTE